MSTHLVNYVLESENIDTIMHFAAQSHVGMFLRRRSDPCRSRQLLR